MHAAPIPIEITQLYVDQRLDVVLAMALSLSRSQARALLGTGQVLLNHRVMTPNDKGRNIAAHDRLAVVGVTDPRQIKPIANPALPLTVLTQGKDYLVVEKPAGVPVHPLEQDETETVLNAVIARYPRIAGIGEGSLRCGVVHRLDTETSGALAFALSEERFRRMRRAFSRHTTRKIYRAVVMGTLEGHGQEAVDLVVARHSPARIEVTNNPKEPGARRCTLDWRALDHGAGRTLLEIDLHTGFLHQIRATFAARNCPVVGDGRYGGAAPDAARMMLHAMTLRIGEIEAICPMPLVFYHAIRPSH